MSIRPIEVQGSFPQSQKSGKLQEQMQQRGQVSQNIIGQQLDQENRQKRRQVVKTNESEKSTLQDQKKNQSNQHNQRKKERDKEDDGTEQKESHPYKGQFVDFSG
ncbi:hypothetical protein AB3N04_18670 [Alkalihalophilus sp. As8PL]|uniref:RNA polymerase subunit sigma n=1 Tax=Alkalihalophilus sp. As8PL TaxID=3237103 RepID=A0AB39BSK1_9BACI